MNTQYVNFYNNQPQWTMPVRTDGMQPVQAPVTQSINQIPSNYSTMQANYFNGMQNIGMAQSPNMMMQGTTLSKFYSGFEEHFMTPHKDIIHPITLTDVQKADLSQKITNFENYKNSLSKEDQARLERSKHGVLDYSIVDGLPEPTLKGYKDFLAKYEKFKQGDFSNITNEDLAQLLYHTNTADLVSDGKISAYAQGRVGSCWFLSMLQNYASTPAGEENIARRIKGPDKDGNYSVILNNPMNQNQFQSYTVTSKELDNYDLSDENSSFSSGDIDARIMEIACEKMLKYQFMNNVVPVSKFLNESLNNIGDILTPEALASNNPENDGNLICSGEIEKKLLVHKALGYKGGINTFVNQKGLSNFAEQFNLNYNAANSNAKIHSVFCDLVEMNGKLVPAVSIQPTGFNSLSEVLNMGLPTHNLTCSTGDEEYSDNDRENRYISTGHVYNLMQYDQNQRALTVNDPYNSAFPHTIDYENFDKVFNEIDYLL